MKVTVLEGSPRVKEKIDEWEERTIRKDLDRSSQTSSAPGESNQQSRASLHDEVERPLRDHLPLSQENIAIAAHVQQRNGIEQNGRNNTTEFVQSPVADREHGSWNRHPNTPPLRLSLLESYTGPEKNLCSPTGIKTIEVMEQLIEETAHSKEYGSRNLQKGETPVSYQMEVVQHAPSHPLRIEGLSSYAPFYSMSDPFGMLSGRKDDSSNSPSHIYDPLRLDDLRENTGRDGPLSVDLPSKRSSTMTVEEFCSMASSQLPLETNGGFTVEESRMVSEKNTHPHLISVLQSPRLAGGDTASVPDIMDDTFSIEEVVQDAQQFKQFSPNPHAGALSNNRKNDSQISTRDPSMIIPSDTTFAWEHGPHGIYPVNNVVDTQDERAFLPMSAVVEGDPLSAYSPDDYDDSALCGDIISMPCCDTQKDTVLEGTEVQPVCFDVPINCDEFEAETHIGLPSQRQYGTNNVPIQYAVSKHLGPVEQSPTHQNFFPGRLGGDDPISVGSHPDPFGESFAESSVLQKCPGDEPFSVSSLQFEVAPESGEVVASSIQQSDAPISSRSGDRLIYRNVDPESMDIPVKDAGNLGSNMSRLERSLPFRNPISPISSRNSSGSTMLVTGPGNIPPLDTKKIRTPPQSVRTSIAPSNTAERVISRIKDPAMLIPKEGTHAHPAQRPYVHTPIDSPELSELSGAPAEEESGLDGQQEECPINQNGSVQNGPAHVPSQENRTKLEPTGQERIKTDELPELPAFSTHTKDQYNTLDSYGYSGSLVVRSEAGKIGVGKYLKRSKLKYLWKIVTSEGDRTTHRITLTWSKRSQKVRIFDGPTLVAEQMRKSKAAFNVKFPIANTEVTVFVERGRDEFILDAGSSNVVRPGYEDNSSWGATSPGSPSVSNASSLTDTFTVDTRRAVVTDSRVYPEFSKVAVGQFQKSSKLKYGWRVHLHEPEEDLHFLLILTWSRQSGRVRIMIEDRILVDRSWDEKKERFGASIPLGDRAILVNSGSNEEFVVDMISRQEYESNLKETAEARSGLPDAQDDDDPDTD